MKTSDILRLKRNLLKGSSIVLLSAGLLVGFSADAQRGRDGFKDRSRSTNNNSNSQRSRTFDNSQRTRSYDNNQRTRSYDNNQRSRSNIVNQSIARRQSNDQNNYQRRSNNYSGNSNRYSVGWTDRLRYNAVARNRSARYSPYNPSWRYGNRPRYYSTVNYVPAGYRSIHYGGYDYRYQGGIFYRPYNNLFMVVRPPLGIYIDILPLGYRRLSVNNYPYYYYDGTFYDEWDHHYRVVSPPVGAVVESIPEGYETITVDGETYYEVDGAQYKPVVQDNGEIWYEVIKAN